ncbi:MAG: glycosyltransferase [Acidobacteriales bacterium]|nr:glycosyltransferase [Terriglobales bacterium]
MKIFYLIDSLNVGGSETQAVQTAVRMAARGHRLVFGCLRLSGPLLSELRGHGIETVEFSPGTSLFSLSAARQIWRLSRYLKRERFDVVHNHDLYSNLMGLCAARLAGVPVVVAVQRDLGDWWWYTPRNRRVLRFLQRRACVVIANSGAIKDQMVGEGFPDGNIVLQRNGVDVARFQGVKGDRASLLVGCTQEHFVAITVANMHVASKGQQFLIEALASLRERHPLLRVALVGDGPLRAGLEQTAARLGVSDRIFFLGQRGGIPGLLSCCDVGVLPSLSEGLPNSVLEYMAAGLPVIASSVGGIPEVIEPGKNGTLVPPGDVNALAQALTALVQDPAGAKRMGEAGRKRAREEFSFESLVVCLEALYSERFQSR